MSPEQVSGERTDCRTDIFSIGIVAYELLTGTKPFDGESATGIMLRILNHNPRPLKDFEHIPAGLDAVVMRALKKEPAHRQSSAAEFARELRTFRATLDTPGPDSAGGETPPHLDLYVEPPFTEKERRELIGSGAALSRWSAVAVLALSLITLLGASTFLYAHFSKPVAGKAETEALSRRSPQSAPADATTSPVGSLAGGTSGKPPVATASIRISSSPPGATLSIDGRRVGSSTPATIELPAGSRPRIRVEKNGWKPAETTLTADDWARGEVGLSLVLAAKVAIEASCDYPFQILDGVRVVSNSATHHAVSIAVPATVTFRAPEYFLEDRRYIESPGNFSFPAPALGTIRIQLVPLLEKCRVSIRRVGDSGAHSRDLGYQPLPDIAVVPGQYAVALDCPSGRGTTVTRTVFAHSTHRDQSVHAIVITGTTAS
jgi:hypothetical protein